MDARLQRRVQRYGWDLAVSDYEAGWMPQLRPLHDRLLTVLAVAPGERVLDIACGNGLLSLRMATQAGAHGEVVGVDLSERMVDRASDQAGLQLKPGRDAAARFFHMDAEALSFPSQTYDAALCALGLMYVPDPVRALQEMHRVLVPGGRLALAVWADRAHCGWSALFDIVADEVTTDVCPLFFQLGQRRTLESRCILAGFDQVSTERLAVTLDYANAADACAAAFAGGPAALAWSRFDAVTRLRVQHRYLETLEPWRDGTGYRIPGEFVLLQARATAEGPVGTLHRHAALLF